MQEQLLKASKYVMEHLPKWQNYGWQPEWQWHLSFPETFLIQIMSLVLRIFFISLAGMYLYSDDSLLSI